MNKHCCQNMEKHLAEGEVAIYYVPKFREYGIKVLDGETSFILIQYCPWCGQKLPESLRDRWFDELEKLGTRVGGFELVGAQGLRPGFQPPSARFVSQPGCGSQTDTEGEEIGKSE